MARHHPFTFYDKGTAQLRIHAQWPHESASTAKYIEWEDTLTFSDTDGAISPIRRSDHGETPVDGITTGGETRIEVNMTGCYGDGTPQVIDATEDDVEFTALARTIVVDDNDLTGFYVPGNGIRIAGTVHNDIAGDGHRIQSIAWSVPSQQTTITLVPGVTLTDELFIAGDVTLTPTNVDLTDMALAIFRAEARYSTTPGQPRIAMLNSGGQQLSDLAAVWVLTPYEDGAPVTTDATKERIFPRGAAIIANSVENYNQTDQRAHALQIIALPIEQTIGGVDYWVRWRTGVNP
jgi:hypothetical protein